jgi:hypothetical protein
MSRALRAQRAAVVASKRAQLSVPASEEPEDFDEDECGTCLACDGSGEEWDGARCMCCGGLGVKD